MCVCVEREREREGERERERTVSFPRPAYPKIHLSVLQTVSVFSDLWLNYLVCLVCLVVFCLFVFAAGFFVFVLFFFCGCTTNQS